MLFYIFVNSDSSDFYDRKIPAPKISSYRLKNRVYPIYKGTKLKKFLKPNDCFIFYLAGSPTSQTKRFVAYGKIKNIETEKNYSEDDVHLCEPIEKIGRLKSVVVGKSVSIYEIKDKLSFISKKRKWGASMQGGIIKITQKDYNLIINEMK